MTRLRTDHGFTLIELLLTIALAMVVFGAVVSFLLVQLPMAQAHPDRADLQQRARAAADILSADLATAGSWADTGGLGPGLACCVPFIQPRRIGTRSPDPPGTARTDVITIAGLKAGAIPAKLAVALLSAELVLESGGGCAPSDPVCGLVEDDDVIVFDAAGHHDYFRLGSPGSSSAPLLLRQPGGAYPYPAGSIAAGVVTRTYYFDPAFRQLRQYDGYQSDVPVIDDVAGVRFEYWGAAGVPARGRVEAGTSTCWFDAAGLPRFGRSVAAAGTPDVQLGVEQFEDGPWCGVGDNRFDADLLRIRRVRAVVRLRASAAAARGTGGAFLDPGTADTASRLVPDVEVVSDVSLRAVTGDY